MTSDDQNDNDKKLPGFDSDLEDGPTDDIDLSQNDSDNSDQSEQPIPPIQDEPTDKIKLNWAGRLKQRWNAFREKVAIAFRNLGQKLKRKKETDETPKKSFKERARELGDRLGKGSRGIPGFFKSIPEKLKQLRKPGGTGGPQFDLRDIGSKLTEFRNRFRTQAKERIEKYKSSRQEKIAAGKKDWQLVALNKASEGYEWSKQRLQKRPPAFYGKMVTVLLCSWFLSDLGAVLIQELIPAPPPMGALTQSKRAQRAKSMSHYNIISERNLVNSRGLIPGEAKPDTTPDQPSLTGPAVKTKLPLNLIGTLVLKDELRSLATLEDQTASKTYPVRVNDEIPKLLRVLKIEARKVTFYNLKTRKNEYIDIPEDTQAPKVGRKKRKKRGGFASKSKGIKKVDEKKFSISRSEIDDQLNDLNSILTQARAVPHYENGTHSGYKLFQIVPGSVYEKLGLKNGDVITGVNGEPIKDPGRAFQLLNELKSSKRMELNIKRNGSEESLQYDIN